MRMKFKTYGMILSLFFALGLVFSFGVEAYGSNGDSTGTTAEDVAADPGNEEKMRSFVERIVNRGFKFETQQVDQYRRIPDSVFRSQGIFWVCCSTCP